MGRHGDHPSLENTGGGFVAVRQQAGVASLATPSWSFGQIPSRFRQSDGDGRGRPPHIVVRASPRALGSLAIF